MVFILSLRFRFNLSFSHLILSCDICFIIYVNSNLSSVIWDLFIFLFCSYLYSCSFSLVFLMLIAVVWFKLPLCLLCMLFNHILRYSRWQKLLHCMKYFCNDFRYCQSKCVNWSFVEYFGMSIIIDIFNTWLTYLHHYFKNTVETRLSRPLLYELTIIEIVCRHHTNLFVIIENNWNCHTYVTRTKKSQSNTNKFQKFRKLMCWSRSFVRLTRFLTVFYYFLGKTL